MERKSFSRFVARQFRDRKQGRCPCHISFKAILRRGSNRSANGSRPEVSSASRTGVVRRAAATISASSIVAAQFGQPIAERALYAAPSIGKSARAGWHNTAKLDVPRFLCAIWLFAPAAPLRRHARASSGPGRHRPAREPTPSAGSNKDAAGEPGPRAPVRSRRPCPSA